HPLDPAGDGPGRPRRRGHVAGGGVLRVRLGPDHRRRRRRGVRMSTVLLPVSQEEAAVPDDATPAQIDDAVARSEAAFAGAWRRDHRRRAEILHAWADRIESEAGSVVAQLVAETGKMIAEARAEVAGSIDALRFNAGLARLPLGRAGALHDGS